MYNLKLNRSKIYEIRWTERGEGRSVTKTQSTGARDLTAARQYLRDWQAGHKAAAGAIETSPLIMNLLDAYERAMAAKGAGETQGYCLKHLRQHFEGERVSSIDADRVRAYVEDRDVASGTARRELSVLRAALRHGWKDRRLTLDQIPHIELPPEGAPRTTFLTEPEEAAFHAAALAYVPTNDPSGHAGDRLSRVARFVAIALNTGARAEAILELEWSRVDLDSEIPAIDFRVDGETYRNKRRGVTPINARLLPILRQAKAEAINSYVLDHAGSIKKSFGTFTKAAGFPHITQHSLRRTCATLLLRAGATLDDIGEILQDDAATVRRHYATYDMASKQRAMARRFG